MIRRIAWAALAASTALIFTSPAIRSAEETKPAEVTAKPVGRAEKEAETAPLFLRVVRDDQKVPQALETSVVRYVGKSGKYAGATVDLIGAVHVGEKSYYEALNKRFETYEVLLYELVADKGTKIPKGGGKGRSSHPLGMMQEGMTDVLGLVHQLRHVDYTKKNFVHADMSPDEFSKKMDERGESWMSMMFRMMGQGMAMQASKPNERPELEMLMAFFDSNKELKLKRALAKQFEDMDVMMAAFEGEEGSTIITERNKAALKVLEDQLKAGKKNIGIFYGAGHLPDMDERLRDEFGLERQPPEWLTAWDMRDAPAKPAAGAKDAGKKEPAAKKEGGPKKEGTTKKHAAPKEGDKKPAKKPAKVSAQPTIGSSLAEGVSVEP
jgi:hypothetical protein